MVRRILFAFAVVLSSSTLAGLTPSNVPVHTHASGVQGGGSLTLSGKLSSTKSCAAGFTRTGPNFCRATNNTNDIWIDATACTERTFTTALPADAVVASVLIRWRSRSNNAVGNRTNDVTFYSDATCTAIASTVLYAVYEFVATAAGTVVGQADVEVLVPLVATGVFRTTQANAGGNGNAEVQTIQLLGYFD